MPEEFEPGLRQQFAVLAKSPLVTTHVAHHLYIPGHGQRWRLVLGEETFDDEQLRLFRHGRSASLQQGPTLSVISVVQNP